MSVRVPVFSEQSMSMPAISSMAARRVTIAPLVNSCFAPIARVHVVTISMARGIEATSTHTAKERECLTISLSECWRFFGFSALALRPSTMR